MSSLSVMLLDRNENRIKKRAFSFREKSYQALNSRRLKCLLGKRCSAISGVTKIVVNICIERLKEGWTFDGQKHLEIHFLAFAAQLRTSSEPNTLAFSVALFNSQ